MENTISNRFYRDSLWYLLGSALPAITLLLRSPIYTRIYSTELYGLYSIVYITYTYISSISLQWITNNAWRYYLKYKKTGNTGTFWTVALLLYLASIVIVMLGSSIWFYIADNRTMRLLIVFGCFYFISNEFLNTLLVPLRLEGKAGFYNILTSGRHTVSFLLLLAMTFKGNFEIEAFFLAPLGINSLIILYILFSPGFSIKLQSVNNLSGHIRRFLNYGFGNLVYNIGLFLLISSDRYIIASFEGYSKVGIYNQTYNIAQIIVTAMFSVLHSALNPLLIHKLEGKRPESDISLVKGFYFAFYLMVPLSILASIFSRQINNLMLGFEFREAWNIMPYIFFGALLAGLNYFAVIKLKFQNKLRELMIASLVAAILNIVLNLIFIPIYGYKIAAITTLGAYIGLFLILFNYGKINLLKNVQVLRNMIISLILPIGFIGFNYGYNLFLNYRDNIVSALLKSFIFAFIYFLITRKFAPFKKEYFE